MVYGFVRQSGGHVSIYSEPYAGTCVRLYLPAYWPAQASVPRPAKLDATDYAGGQVILVVEDDSLVREQVSNQLTVAGYRVHAAATADEALTILKEQPDIDLLFTDVMMPGMTGRELAEKAGELRPKLPVLFTSGYTEEVFTSDEAGMRKFSPLSKPYRKAELLERIRRTIHEQ